jgi:hypothetical protein
MFFKILARLHDDAVFSVDAQLSTGAIETQEMAEEIKNDIMEDCETITDFIDFVCRKYDTMMKETEYDKIN